jgi:TonB-linked SusC/RagA family outer membrane protein
MLVTFNPNPLTQYPLMKKSILIIKRMQIRICMLVVLLAYANIFCSMAEETQQNEIQISGIVTDASTNEPLPGVAIAIKGTSIGTITDIDGKYSIQVMPGKTLQFSYIGYLSEEIVITTETEISVNLVPDIIGLDEVVVTGYGVQKKSDLTGAISSVSGNELTRIPISGLDQALEGMAAGVTIIPKTGRPGSGVDIQIRGISSINGTNPKIVVDGVAQDDYALSRINPNDVASIEILKDASSAAIYGATGGNGVILVTTKKGIAGEMQTSFNTYLGVEEPIKKLDLMNSQQWLEVVEEMSASHVPYTTRPDTFKTYDWQDILFQRAFTQNYDMTVTGGSEKSNFMISSSFSKQNGIIESTDNQRFTIRVNSDHKLTRHIMLDEKIYYINTVNLGFEDWEYEQYYSNPVMPALQMIPFQPAYDEYGKWTVPAFGGGKNPMVQLDMKDKTRRNNNLDGNFGITITPLKGLSYTSRFTGALGFKDNKEFLGIYEASGTDSRKQNELIQSMSRSLSWNLQNIVTYTGSLFNAHNFTLMAGMEANRYWGYDLNGSRVDFRSDLPEMLYPSMSQNDTLDREAIEGLGYEGRGYRYFGRLNYDYKGKYLITANVSQDYSTRFGPANRKGTFPSISVGWKFTQEEFMKDIPALTFGKIRAGWGQTGANARSDFAYLTTIMTPGTFRYSFDNQVSQIGAGPVQVANPGIKWEAINMTNIGLDLSFFNYQLNFTAEYFIKVNDGMLMYQDVPWVAGTYSMGRWFDGAETLPEVNIGSMRNSGFEFTLGHKKRIQDFKYSVDMNLSFVRNKVLDLAGNDSIYDGSAHIISPITLTRVGGSISEFNGYLTDGLFRESDPVRIVNGKEVIINQPFTVNEDGDTTFAQPGAVPGDVRYVDLNRDGKISIEDKTSLGSPLPKFSYSLSVNLEYKGFDLYLFLNGTVGNKVFNGTKQYLYYSQGNGNRAAAYANRYKDEIIKDGFVVVHENHDTDIPRHWTENYNKPSDFFIEDGSFLRIRTIQIGYTFPTAISTKAGIDKFRIYIGAKNLWTLTSYQAFNPEVSSGDYKPTGLGIDYGNYPATRMFLAGINMNF